MAQVHLTTYRDAACSCCEGWVGAARDNSYAVTIYDMDHDARLRRFALTEVTASCHTTLARGYLIEGHIPFDIVGRLLSERPKGRGITLLGMPLGVPGMGGIRNTRLDALTLEARPHIYATV